MSYKNDNFCEPYMKLVNALIDKHAVEITALDLSEISGFTDVFFVVKSRSELNARTLKDTAKDVLDEMGLTYRVEGEESNRWTLIDAGDVIVNVLSRDGCEFYRLDSLWGDAPTMKFEDKDE